MSVAASTAIGLGIAAGTAGAGIYAADKSAGAATTAAADTSGAATQAAQIQANASTQNANTAARTAEQALQFQQAESQLSLDQYNQQQERLQPYRNLGAFALGQAPSAAPAPLTLPGVPSAGGTSTSTSTSTSALPTSGSGSSPANVAPLLTALNSGQSPQAVINQMNTSQGLQSGSSYAWRAIPNAPGGGVVEVPGGAYLAPGPNGVWGYTAAPSGAGGTATSASAASGPVTLNYTPTTIGTPVYAPTPGTLTAPTPQAPAYTPLSQIGAA